MTATAGNVEREGAGHAARQAPHESTRWGARVWVSRGVNLTAIAMSFAVVSVVVYRGTLPFARYAGLGLLAGMLGTILAGALLPARLSPRNLWTVFVSALLDTAMTGLGFALYERALAHGDPTSTCTSCITLAQPSGAVAVVIWCILLALVLLGSFALLLTGWGVVAAVTSARRGRSSVAQVGTDASVDAGPTAPSERC